MRATQPAIIASVFIFLPILSTTFQLPTSKGSPPGVWERSTCRTISEERNRRRTTSVRLGKADGEVDEKFRDDGVDYSADPLTAFLGKFLPRGEKTASPQAEDLVSEYSNNTWPNVITSGPQSCLPIPATTTRGRKICVTLSKKQKMLAEERSIIHAKHCLIRRRLPQHVVHLTVDVKGVLKFMFRSLKRCGLAVTDHWSRAASHHVRTLCPHGSWTTREVE